MTRSELMTIVTAMAETSGRAYVTTAAEQNKVANRRMEMFAAATKCLYDDAITFTLTPDTAVYDLRGNAFGKRVLSVEHVIIDGSPLYDFDGGYGPVALDELRQREPSYLGTSSGAPQYACEIPPQSLRLWPAPDQAYANSFVAGWWLPPDIDTTGAGDGTSIVFSHEDCELVAIYVALGLIEPTAATETDYERIGAFSKIAAARFQQLIEKSGQMLSGPSVRGAVQGSGVRVVSLGR